MKSFKLEFRESRLAARLADPKKRQLWKEVAKYPQYPTNILKLGRWLMHDGQFPEAVMVYEFGARKHPGSYPILLGLGSAYEHSGRETDAIRTYRRVVRQFPDRFRGYLRLEKLYRRGLNYEDAIRLYQEIPAVNPVKEKGFQRLFRIYAGIGNLEAAVKTLQDAIKNYGESYARCLELGKLYFRQGDFVGAVQSFESAVAFQPQSIYTRTWLGIALKELGNLRLAEYEFNEILRIKPDSFQGLIHQAELKVQSKQFEAARNLLDRLDQISPGNARVDICRGWLALEQGTADTAILHCGKGLQEATVYFVWEQVLGHRIMARAMKELGKTDDLEYHTLMAAAIAGKDTYESLIGLAEKLIKRGEGKLAIRVLTRILELFPHNTRAQIGLGEVFLKNGRLQEAILICQEALKRIRPIFIREKIRAHVVIAQAYKLQRNGRQYKKERKTIRSLLGQVYLKTRARSQIRV